MITVDDLKALKHGQAIVIPETKNEHVKDYRWRVNGVPKTWKTRPQEVRVPVKFGLYAYDHITHDDIDYLNEKGAYID